MISNVIGNQVQMRIINKNIYTCVGFKERGRKLVRPSDTYILKFGLKISSIKGRPFVSASVCLSCTICISMAWPLGIIERVLDMHCSSRNGSGGMNLSLFHDAFLLMSQSIWFIHGCIVIRLYMRKNMIKKCMSANAVLSMIYYNKTPWW